MEQGELPGFPVDNVDVLRSDSWSLQLVQEVARFFQVGNVRSVGEERRLCPCCSWRQSIDELWISGGRELLFLLGFVSGYGRWRAMRTTYELVNSTRVDLYVQVTRDRILPAHWEDLDVLLLPRRQILEGNLEAVRLHSEPCRSTLGGPDRDVRVRHVLDAHAHGQRLVLCREQVKHDFAGDDYRGA